MEAAVDSFNRVHYPYRNEATLIFVTNAWELLAKAILVKQHHSISRQGTRGETIPAEVAVSRLRQNKIIIENQEDCIQQVISLRHAATHHILPNVPEEVMHHLLFFSCKFFRDALNGLFPMHAKDMKDNYLSLSFSTLTTYADKVQKLVSRIKRSEHDKTLIWLLERGIRFDGAAYLTQSQFEDQYRRKKRVLPHLDVSKFIRDAEMIRIVPIQAPRNYTADIRLRKGPRNDPSLPVLIRKTEVESDYPHLTSEIALKLGKNSSFIAATAKHLGLKNNPDYHQKVRASQKSYIQKYSQAGFDRLAQFLKENPTFNPYRLSK